jgi:hypothetical protein
LFLGNTVTRPVLAAKQVLLGLALMLAGAANASDRTYAQYGQKLIDDALARHPQVIAITLRAKPSNGDRPADIRVVAQQRLGTNRVAPGSTTEVGLQDVAGETVGSIELTFSDSDSRNSRDRAVVSALVQKEIGARIWKADSLFESYPVDPNVPYRTYAQALVEKTLERHSDLLVLCLHLTPPHHDASITFACNVGRIGMVDDNGDITIMQSGQFQARVMPGGITIKIEGPLRDTKDRTIGAFSAFYRHGSGDSDGQFKVRAAEVGRELARQIPNLESLAAPLS